jgi:hypothetical protein
MFYKLNEDTATGTFAIVSLDAQRLETLILLVKPPTPMPKVYVKDAAEFALAVIVNNPRTPLKDRVAQAVMTLEHRWKLWAENPEWKIKGGPWSHWPNAQ